MKHAILDTDVASFILKADTRAALYEPHLSGKQRVLSFATVAELRLWTLERRWGVKRLDELEQFIRTATVHPFNDAITRCWAKIVHERIRAGRPINNNDAWIAATAVHHSTPLLSHNRRDFDDIDGLILISEAP